MTDRSEITNEMLRVNREVTNRPIGDADIPEEVSQPPAEGDFPYAILYSVPGGGYDGAFLTAPHGDVTFAYRTISVGRTREQAEFMAGLVHEAMVGRDADGVLKHVMAGVDDREPDGTPGGIDSDGIGPQKIFTYSDGFLVTVYG